MHCFVLTTHEELWLDTSTTVNETNNINAETEIHNLTVKTVNGKQNTEQEKDKEPKKDHKKGKSVVTLGDSMGEERRGEEMSKNYQMSDVRWQIVWCPSIRRGDVQKDKNL